MNRTFDVLMAIVWVAAIFVLVRPKSQGPKFVTNLGSALSGLLKSATGGGTWNS